MCLPRSALLIEDLKRLCEAVLTSVVDEQNAGALMEVADRCFAQRLKAACTDVLGIEVERQHQRN